MKWRQTRVTADNPRMGDARARLASIDEATCQAAAFAANADGRFEWRAACGMGRRAGLWDLLEDRPEDESEIRCEYVERYVRQGPEEAVGWLRQNMAAAINRVGDAPGDPQPKNAAEAEAKRYVEQHQHLADALALAHGAWDSTWLQRSDLVSVYVAVAINSPPLLGLIQEARRTAQVHISAPTSLPASPPVISERRTHGLRRRTRIWSTSTSARAS